MTAQSREHSFQDIPAEWRQVLRTFQDKGAKEAVIAGGALRDLFNHKPVKDVDIFIRTQGSQKKNRQMLEEAFRSTRLEITYQQSGNDYFSGERFPAPKAKNNGRNVAESWTIIAGRDKTEYNIIFVPELVSPLKLIESFDFGLCQIGYDGKIIFSTNRYNDDVRDKRICFALTDVNDTSAEHLQRIIKKYPDWKLCAESKKILSTPDTTSPSRSYRLPRLGFY